MIIEKHSVPTYTADGANMSKFRAIFDNLCEWDSVAEVSSEEVKYTYGCITITIKLNSSYYFVYLEYGGTSTTISKTDTWFNVAVIKSATSVGMLIYNINEQNASIPTDIGNDSVHKVVLTKLLNVNTNSEEKGLIYAKGTGTAGQFKVRAISESNATTATDTSKTIFTNAAVTILQPAASTTYTGYCPYVFIPEYQTCASSNCKAKVNGATYYIMGGSLYLLDD